MVNYIKKTKFFLVQEEQKVDQEKQGVDQGEKKNYQEFYKCDDITFFKDDITFFEFEGNFHCVIGTRFPYPKFLVSIIEGYNSDGDEIYNNEIYYWFGSYFNGKKQFLTQKHNNVIRNNPLIESLELTGVPEIKKGVLKCSSSDIYKTMQYYDSFLFEHRKKDDFETKQYYYVTGIDGWYQFDNPVLNDKSGSQIYLHGSASNSKQIIKKRLEQAEGKQEEDNKQQGDNKQEEDKQKVSTCYFFTDYSKESGGSGVCGIYKKKFNIKENKDEENKDEENKDEENKDEDEENVILKVGYNQVTGSINGYYVQADSIEESENIIGSIVEDNKRYYIKKIEGKIYLFYKGFVGKTDSSSIEQGKKYTFKDEYDNEKKIEISDENFVQGNQYKNCYYGDIATW